ncbi:uncharacterized protein LOC116838516 [Chelonoidis abingdonii]|uniref:uncharacterized protein LOC116838516 n=1 Tax=Chelonoidis abingdonii TaxID=106734 RepID=UPI0013F1A99F|nr:uncharacterized protein LOC116838516 isoform X2 [Chelonoidis abingdonii]
MQPAPAPCLGTGPAPTPRRVPPTSRMAPGHALSQSFAQHKCHGCALRLAQLTSHLGTGTTEQANLPLQCPCCDVPSGRPTPWALLQAELPGSGRGAGRTLRAVSDLPRAACLLTDPSWGKQEFQADLLPLAHACCGTGKQSGGGRSQASSEKRRKKGAKQNSVPSRREQPQGARGPLHKEPRTASTRMAAHREELMSAGRKEKSRMAEESSSGSSSSPSPGDTLPWNLAKHQRTKRTKSSSGSGTVLDPAERAVIRIAALICIRASDGVNRTEQLWSDPPLVSTPSFCSQRLRVAQTWDFIPDHLGHHNIPRQ